MEGDERGNFSKGPDWKTLFENLNLWLSQRLNKTLAPSIFKHIHQNSRAYSRGKKSLVLVNDWVNNAYWKEPEQSKALTSKFGQNTDGGFGEESQPQVKFCDLYPYVSLQTVYEYEYMNVIMNMSINISTWIWTWVHLYK